MAQSFMALATTVAAALSSRLPSFMERCTCRNTSLGSLARMTESLKTMEPKVSVTVFMCVPHSQ